MTIARILFFAFACGMGFAVPAAAKSLAQTPMTGSIHPMSNPMPGGSCQDSCRKAYESCPDDPQVCTDTLNDCMSKCHNPSS
jgi:hypothetical protein